MPNVKGYFFDLNINVWTNVFTKDVLSNFSSDFRGEDATSTFKKDLM